MELTEQRNLVHKTRDARRSISFPKLSPAERDSLIKKYHPDHRAHAYRPIIFGPNAGQLTVTEVATLLEGESPVPADLDLTPDYSVDVLVVGGGGAGCASALHAHAQGANVLLATKLRLGDSNSVMAQGGMQIAVASDDSPVQHFLDTLKGGHMKNDHQLLKVMVEEGPSIAKWLLELGVLFDRDADGNLHVKKGGGSSKARLLTCSDYTGLEIMRVLKDEVLNQKIPLLEFVAAVELLSDAKGACTGAVLKDLDNNRFIVVAAKTVIMATGGIGRLHIQGFPTSNHFGATGDALVLAYRLGVPLVQIDTFQYHPSGGVYPEQLVGALVTEGIRSEGGHLVNAKGERFVNELDTRDVVSSSIIRECEEGRGIRTPSGRVGVWLDTPLLDVEHGPGTLDKHFPAMVRQYERYQVDIRKDPVLIYPTLHYQNGGVKIDVNGETPVANLFVAGEASGGLHGRNRLMGNSLLDLMVFGKRTGILAAERAKSLPNSSLTLDHLKRFRAEAKRHQVSAGVISPMVLPAYTNK
ncbi:MAG TPA: FAD-binding protein [Nitrospirales bacterium]|nr:succinate dehydrogenase/fumarate reductase flavoprotein subunit [Nitrospiraceae bacterium]HNP30468.1 FAD-binding protein [Nitrospirales bacterium]